MRFASTSMHPTHVLRVATYNIHKGVRGMGPNKRLEIHNLGLGIEALDADLVYLQEVRLFNHSEARQFPDTHIGWPKMPQADYLAPEGYDVAYRTNAVTRGGEHGNARVRPSLRAARPAACARRLERHHCALHRGAPGFDAFEPRAPGRADRDVHRT
jgi:endonuclease/exonuclease/phosphatase family metal-dependent hydrolase